MSAGHAVAPRLAERLYAELAERDHFGEAAAPVTPGNLLEPMEEGDSIADGWGGDGGGRLRVALGVSFTLPVLFALRRVRR